MGRMFVIPDIHGELRKVKELVEYFENEIGIGEEDKIICLGDYVDRGFNSKGVIEYLLKLKKRYDVVFLRGNHDDWFLDFLKNPFTDSFDTWFTQGGKETLESYYGKEIEGMGEVYEVREKILREHKDHVDFLRRLLLYTEDDYFYYVHAGVNPVFSKIESNRAYDYIMMNREVFFNHKIELDKRVVVGHTIVRLLEEGAELLDWKDRICLDGGAFAGGPLNGMVVEEDGSYGFVQVR